MRLPLLPERTMDRMYWLATHHRAILKRWHALAIGLVVFSAAWPCVAQDDWAPAMFNTVKHDFGTVARGAKAQYRFQVKNIYEEDAHILSVESSCGCTTPQIVKPDLKTFEVGEIVADFNTRQMVGHKQATITVTFDKPFPAKVRLHVAGFIRGDVVLTPGDVDFGTVDVGTAAEKHVTVAYAGREDWRILEVKSPNPNIVAQSVETGRGNGHVNYDLMVQLTNAATSGYLKEQVTLVTNDPRNPEILVDVLGRVASEITVSPSSMFMGVVQPGQVVTRNLIVRGKRPFKIVKIKCEDSSFEISLGSRNQSKQVVHVLPVVFTAGEKEGKISEVIEVETDLGDVPSCTAYAQVVGSSQPKLAKPRIETNALRIGPSNRKTASSR